MAIQAVAAGLLIRSFRQGSLVAEERADWLRSPEGRADLERVGEYVRTFFPEVSPLDLCDWIDRGRGAPSKTFWTLDPIDGTRGFLRGGQYATALALVRDGELRIATLACPNLRGSGALAQRGGILVLAVKGKGCWGTALEGEDRWVPFKVSECRDPRQARVLESVEMNHRNGDRSRRFRDALGIQQDPLKLDSQAKHVVLAMGGAEIFFRTLPPHQLERREKIWDVAPGALAIEEAGGRVTDLEGRPLDYGCGEVLSRSPGFVATNGFLHEIVLDMLSRARGG